MKPKLQSFLDILLLIALVFGAAACATTGQKPPDGALVLPLVQAATNAAGAYYHVPPDSTKALTKAEADIWGGYAQVQAGQPVQNGALEQNIGNAIAAAIPANTSNTKTIAALQAAAQSLQAQKAAPTSP